VVNNPQGELNMKKRYTEEQIIGTLKQAESGIPVADLL